jgi:hypothetical protein
MVLKYVLFLVIVWAFVQTSGMLGFPHILMSFIKASAINHEITKVMGQ